MVLTTKFLKVISPKAKKSKKLKTQIRAQQTNSVKTVPKKPSKILSRKNPKIIDGMVVESAKSKNLRYFGF